MRGEHLGLDLLDSHSSGSSPLARGALSHTSTWRPRLRIIPACAGSTDGSEPIPDAPEDHPRLRGEHRPVAPQSTFRSGSSPLARGALPRVLARDVGAGIIPACAGSTLPRSRRIRSTQDHPRLRGEHFLFRQPRAAQRGSSPLARGALCRLGGVGATGGIIPACAGSMSQHLPPQGSCAGSSPLARGARAPHGSLRVVVGIIPACAGSTKGRV